MAILNYGNQFKYSGEGYIDSKMAPVNNIDELGDEISEFVNSDDEVEDVDNTLKQSFKTTILNALKKKFQKD